MDKISVVTVCLNAEKTIRKTIQSVLDQTYKNIEYILIDGDSIDKTNQIIEEFRAKFEIKGIKYIHISEKDSGIFDAMNKGILAATGDWIHFLNSDDSYVDKNVIENFLSLDNTNVECLYGDTINILGKDRFYRESFEIGVLYYRNPYVHQALFCRMPMLLDYMFDTDYRYAADFDQAVRLYADGRLFKHIHYPVCFFSLEGKSQLNNMGAIMEFEASRRKNKIANKCIIKRYALYFAVAVIKGVPPFYHLYINIKNSRDTVEN